MLGKAFIGKYKSSAIADQLNSVNKIFIKAVEKLKKTHEELVVEREDVIVQLEELKEEKSKLDELETNIQNQIKKYEEFIV